METTTNSHNIQSNHKKTEVIGIHANAILQRNIANSDEVNKRMDSLCMDPKICIGILGEEVYEISKSKLTTSKPFLDIQDYETIKKLPEFQEFLRKYQLEKERQETINLQTEELAEKKNLLKEMDLPLDIQSKKNEIDKVKKTIRDIIDEKEEKNVGNYRTFIEHIQRSTLDDNQKREKLNIIYDFIFNHMESNSTKKKRMVNKNESSVLFYKRLGIDYLIGDVRMAIQSEEKKINDQIKKWKEKKGQNMSINKKTDFPQNDYTDEALQIFIGDIPKNRDIRSRFYLPEDQKDISHIQSYFKTHLDATIKSPDIDNLIKTYDIDQDSIEKEREKIKIHTNHYLEIQRRKLAFKDRFEKGNRNPREYLFDRLVEYVGQDILSYEIAQSIKNKPKYHGTIFEIKKTDGLDDSSAGADYIIIYKFKDDPIKKIAAIDLYISDKQEKIIDKNVIHDNQDGNIDSLEEKLMKAKELKIPYSSYIKLFGLTKNQSYTMKPIRRYVEKEDPTMVYTILNAIIKDKKLDIGILLEEFKNKGNIYGLIKEKGGNKTIVSINDHLNHDIIQELEQTAA